jgi:hypothetical protein
VQELKAKLRDPGARLLLYGTTPPRHGTAPEQVAAAADKLAARLEGLPLDAVVVYDIQDETGRTEFARPFPFAGTVDPRGYSRLLIERIGRPAIAYKALGAMTEGEWRPWLAEARQAYGVEFLSIVGRPTSGIRHPLPLSRAIRIAAGPASGLTVGGVVIAERHTDERSESARLLAKSIEGCGYFISQTVYHAPPTQRLLRDYLRDCRGAGVEPRRIVLTFAPCGLPALAGCQRRPRDRARDPRRRQPAREIDRDLLRQPAPHPRRRLRGRDPARRQRRERVDQPRRDRRQRRSVPCSARSRRG